ncbi:hypothetical protein DFJ77DRAFT_512368 [Powellomyces hirtus]|nr:hypothetical protein DFJ77DRAFT_512368 [Powellomyces hirtus]
MLSAGRLRSTTRLRPAAAVRRCCRAVHSGRATPEATRLYADRFPNLATATVPKKGWTVSQAGFGGYRVKQGVAMHGEALSSALSAGDSERLIGTVLSEKVKQGELARESVVIITKAGYLMSPKNAAPRYPFEHAVVADRVAHSIAPEFLEREITASLQRLGLETIDVFMLNNPERLLIDKRFELPQVYECIARAAQHLDKEVERGRIASYGLCSNSLPNRSAHDHLSLPQILASMHDLQANHSQNFVAIEYPFNIFEHDAYDRWFDGAESLMECASINRLFQFCHRPIMAIANGSIRVLSTNLGISVDEEPTVVQTLSEAFETVSQLELALPELLGGTSDDTALVAKFVWGQVLSDNLTRLSQNMFAAKHYLQRQVFPALERDIQILLEESQGAQNEADIVRWAGLYQKHYRELEAAFLNLSAVSLVRANTDLARILGATAQPDSILSESDPLAATAIRMTRSALAASAALPEDQADSDRSQEGCVLVGMRNPKYVPDVIKALSDPVLKPDAVDRILQSSALA